MVNSLLRTVPQECRSACGISRAESLFRTSTGLGMAQIKTFRSPLAARRLAAVGIVLIAASGLSACKTLDAAGGGDEALTTGSLGAAARQDGPSLKATAAAAQRWKRNPKDIRAGLAYARQLELLEQKDEQIAVLKKLVSLHPGNMDLRARLGRAMLKAGRSVQAEGVFRAMIQGGHRDWKTFNALGSALAAQGRFDEARAQYALALKASPGNPKIINNIALSHILEGNPARAEKLLREALATPEGRKETRIRQNLALALGLQGRFREARYVASQDLLPAEVEANMAYLRRMLGGSADIWKKLQKG